MAPTDPRGTLTKLYYRIGEVADRLGVEEHVIRYWEHQFRSIRPQRSPKNQRMYSRKNVEDLERVRDLLRDEGLTTAGARKRLQRRGLERRDTEDPLVARNAKLREELLAIREEIVALLDGLGAAEDAENAGTTPPPKPNP